MKVIINKMYSKLDLITNNISEKEIKTIIPILFYRIILDLLYVLIMNPLYAYLGFTFKLAIFNIVLSYLVIVFVSPFLVKILNKNNLSSLIIFIISVIYFIPFTSLFALYTFDVSYFVFGLLFWILLIVFEINIPEFYIKRIEIDKCSTAVFNILYFIFLISIIFVWGYYSNFRINLDIINVYDIRAEASSYDLPSFIKYVLSFSTIALPIYLLYYLERKKYFFSILTIFIFILSFSISSHKSAFFIFVLSIICYFIYKKTYKYLIIYALNVGIIISSLIYFVADNIILFSLFYRRVLYVPAFLSTRYYEFFSDNNLNLFRSGIMDNFGFESIYGNTLPQVINYNYVGNIGSANNGLLGDAFSNLGFLSIFVMPIIIFIIFRLLDIASYKLDYRIAIVAVIYYSFTFLNSSWSVILLSHGYLFICFLLFLFPRKKIDEVKGDSK